MTICQTTNLKYYDELVNSNLLLTNYLNDIWSQTIERLCTICFCGEGVKTGFRYYLKYASKKLSFGLTSTL